MSNIPSQKVPVPLLRVVEDRTEIILLIRGNAFGELMTPDPIQGILLMTIHLSITFEGFYFILLSSFY